MNAPLPQCIAVGGDRHSISSAFWQTNGQADPCSYCRDQAGSAVWVRRVYPSRLQLKKCSPSVPNCG